MITAAVHEREHYLNASYGLKSWLLTKDHKRIAVLYLVTITLFFFLGGAFATLIRVELLTPQGDLVSTEVYNKLFTMHGVAMVFFFLIPSIPATLGNFLIPLMIGARDLAFPKLNLLSWYLLVIGGLNTVLSLPYGPSHAVDRDDAIAAGRQRCSQDAYPTTRFECPPVSFLGK